MLINSLRMLGRSSIEIIRTRLEILSLDAKMARARQVSILMLAASTFFIFSLGIILGVFWIIIKFWDTDRLLVLAILTGAFLFIGVIMLIILILKLNNGPHLFEGTLAELEKDIEAFGGVRRGHE